MKKQGQPASFTEEISAEHSERFNSESLREQELGPPISVNGSVPSTNEILGRESMQGREGLRGRPARQYQAQTGNQRRQEEQFFNMSFHK